PDEIAHPVYFLELALQIGVFFSQAAVLESLVDDELQLLHEVLGLQDVVEGAHFQRLDGGLGAGKSSQQDELVVEPVRPKFPQEIDARHVCHFYVGNNEIDIRRLDLVE